MQTIGDKFYWNPEKQCLVVDWSEALGVSCQQVVDGWGTGLGVRDYLFGAEDDLALADTRLDLIAASYHPAIAQWQESFPKGALSALRGLGSWQAELMVLCARHEEAEAWLLNEARVLWLWFDYCRSQGYSHCQLLRGLRADAAQLMTMMGLDGSSLTLRLVRALDKDALRPEVRQPLRRLLNKPHLLRRLLPAGKLNSQLLHALDRWPWMTGYPIQALFSQAEPALIEALESIFSADNAQLGVEAIEQLRGCRSLKQVKAVEHRWMARINLHAVLASLDVKPKRVAVPAPQRLPILQMSGDSLRGAQTECLKMRHTVNA